MRDAQAQHQDESVNLDAFNSAWFVRSRNPAGSFARLNMKNHHQLVDRASYWGIIRRQQLVPANQLLALTPRNDNFLYMNHQSMIRNASIRTPIAGTEGFPNVNSYG